MQLILTLLLALANITLAQNIFSTGSGQLPACGSTCAKMNQAAQACGGTSSATQGIWNCFCQSAYLKPLYTAPTGTCDDTCTNAADAQQLMTWYKSSCGTDNGASEHANLAGATATTPATGSTSTGASTSSGQSSGNSWWSSHYQWVIMLIALAVGLTLFALLAIWLRRRHDRKQDLIRGGFNVGITERSAPHPMSQKPPPPQAYMAGGAASHVSPSGMEEGGSGAGSPARSRENFMPYGYNYSRSESRVGAGTPASQNQEARTVGRTPLSREIDAATPVDDIEVIGKGKKRVLVREKQVGPA